jgi:hypothetical protein
MLTAKMAAGWRMGDQATSINREQLHIAQLNQSYSTPRAYQSDPTTTSSVKNLASEPQVVLRELALAAGSSL